MTNGQTAASLRDLVQQALTQVQTERQDADATFASAKQQRDEAQAIMTKIGHHSLILEDAETRLQAILDALAAEDQPQPVVPGV